MTTQEIINYYANLLIIEYIGQPNAYATIQATAALFVMSQVPLSVLNGYNMNGTAVGVQLDILGKYAGVVRTGTGINNQPITLDDADFFSLIKAAILTNSANSDLNSIQNLINIYFPNQLFVYDHQDMRMSYLINTSIGSLDLVELFISEGLLPKPMGVELAAPIYSSSIKFFGMVDAQAVYTYSQQNSVSISAAVTAIAAAQNIEPFNDATNPTTGTWLDARLGVG